MREVRLIEILSEAAAALTAPEADADAVERVVADALESASVPCTLRPTSTGVEIDCSRSPGRLELAFVSALSDCAKLALAAAGVATGRTLDAHAFALELERAASVAQWRDQPLAVAVFEVSGMEMGPGMIDQADTVAEVGELALSAVRQDDRVAHLGAASSRCSSRARARSRLARRSSAYGRRWRRASACPVTSPSARWGSPSWARTARAPRCSRRHVSARRTPACAGRTSLRSTPPTRWQADHRSQEGW